MRRAFVRDLRPRFDLIQDTGQTLSSVLAFSLLARLVIVV